MLQIRQGVFETNSSSTHSITMCSQDEFDAWKNGEVYLNDGWWRSNLYNPAKDKKFITKEEAISLITTKGYFGDDELLEEEPEVLESKVFPDSGIYSFDIYPPEDSSLEYFEESYTTPSGETVIAFGEYGYDY